MPQNADRDVADAETIEGGPEAAENIQKWMKQLRDNVEIEGNVEMTLYQWGRSKDDERPIVTVDFEHSLSDEQQAEAMVDAAIEEISHLQMPKMRFVLRAEGFRARISFLLKMDLDEEAEDYEDLEDAPNRTGLIAQLMRHNERTTGMSHKAMKNVIEEQRRELERRERRIETLENKQVEVMRAMEDLQNMRHVRDMEVQKMRNSDKRLDQVADVVMLGAPIVMAKIFGGGAAAAQMQSAPGVRSPFETIVESLLNSMTQEQFVTIFNSELFTLPQKAALKEMAMFMLERRNAEEEARKKKEAEREKENGAPPATTPADKSGETMEGEAVPAGA